MYLCVSVCVCFPDFHDANQKIDVYEDRFVVNKCKCTPD